MSPGRTRHAAAMVGIAMIGVISYRMLTTLDGRLGQVCILVLLWTIATTGLNIIQGLTGYPSLVQASFYAGGAYVSSLLLERGHAAAIAGVVGVVATMAGGVVVGLVFARTRGQYFAIGTLFSAAVVTLVLTNARGVTGGQQGMPVVLAFSPSLTLRLIAASVSVGLATFYVLSRVALGERMLSVREDEDLAEHLGVRTARVKLIALVLSSAFGAWAGVLLAQRDGIIAPSQFTFGKSFLMFVAIGLAGYGRLLSPLVGSFLVVGLPELVDLGPGVSQIFLGVLFIVITLLVPGGIIGGLESLCRAGWRAVRPAPPPGPPEPAPPSPAPIGAASESSR